MGPPGRARAAPLEMDPEQFRRLGHALVDDIARFLGSWEGRPVTRGETPAALRALVGDGPLPEEGTPAGSLLTEATRLLTEHSLFNGHPRFWGYITSSAAPLGALADLLAASVNPNVGSFLLSPAATTIETQTVRWIGELIGFSGGSREDSRSAMEPRSRGARGGSGAPPVQGLLVSGGNMANFVGFLAGRRAKAPWDVRAKGTGEGKLAVYASSETHTWIEKAMDLFGLGTDSLRSIPPDAEGRMRTDALRDAIAKDRAAGVHPLLVVGTAGSVSTGAVDPLREIAEICKTEGLWFHVDGAYGGFAAALPDASEDLRALSLADSVAVDPHKWLYAPLEAGCTLVRDPEALRNAFRYHPAYYHFDTGEEATNFYEMGPQNSRGFRALKVWLGLRSAGRAGVVASMAADCALARELFEICGRTPEIGRATCALSIATFRYVPAGLGGRADAAGYLDALNEEIVTRMQAEGEAFVSNAVIAGRYHLRACVVNFRTTSADVAALPPLVVRLGREIDAAKRPASLRG